MNIQELESILGANFRERLFNEIVETVVTRVMSPWDDDENIGGRLQTMAKTSIEDAVKSKVNEIGQAHVYPEIGKMIDSCVLQETGRWGDKIGKPLTFTEFLVLQAQKYVTEQVDDRGRNAEESRRDGSSFRPSTTRCIYLVNARINESITAAMKTAIKSLDETIAEAIGTAVKTVAENVMKSTQVKLTHK